MKALLSTLRWDLVLNVRQGIAYAALFVLLVWSICLVLVPEPFRTSLLITLLFVEISIFGLYLMPGLFYLEQAERILSGLVVTPMPAWIWLVSKSVVLSLQTAVIGTVIVLIAHGPQVSWGWFCAGMFLSGLPLILLGFAVAARFRGLAEYILPSLPILLVLQLPLLEYWQVWLGWHWWLWPTMPGLALLEVSFAERDPAHGLWALPLGVGYLAPVFLLALRQFRLHTAGRAESA